MEAALGIFSGSSKFTLSIGVDLSAGIDLNVTLGAVAAKAGSPLVRSALLKSVPVLVQVAREIGVSLVGIVQANRAPLWTKYVLITLVP